PKVALALKGTNLRARKAAACVPAVTLDAQAAFDAGEAKVKIAISRDRKDVLVSDGVVKLNLADLLAGAALRWEASAKTTLDGFPLEVVGAFLTQPILGDLSGTIALAGLHSDASIDADLSVRALTLDRALFPTGKAKVKIADGALTASLRLDQSDGYAELSSAGKMRWGAELVPALDMDAPLDGVLRAKNFRADAAMPFVRDFFTELDGRVDADAKLHVVPGGKDGTIEGALVIRDGVFELPQISERFHAVQGRVVMKPWGTLRLDDFSAQGPTGKVTASAQAVFRGISLESGTAKLQIARAESLPLVFDGVPLGKAYGEMSARIQRGPGERLDVTVEVPSFHLELPQSTGHSVQPLEPDPTVKIGLHSKDVFVVIPLAPPPPQRSAEALAIRFTVDLGKDVEVKRDTTIAIQAQGKTVIDIGREVTVSGQIRLSRGKLEIQGKQFIVERGTVTFVGADPTDPQVVATAHWDAPGGIRVYADFSGHVTTGKLTLRAEPSLTQDEILALILFGSPDGTFGATPSGGQGASAGLKAAGFAGGIVTQGLNKAISDLTSADITTRLDTSEADNPRPELAVQLSKKVSARLSYKLGVPAPGDNPDRTELTIGWRFVRNWSIEAVVGDQGSTALDVVWRLRY
ncbi:MAG: translocation/assembly module TamB domain-containing protein, partial [Minicystis sp.]